MRGTEGWSARGEGSTILNEGETVGAEESKEHDVRGDGEGQGGGGPCSTNLPPLPAIAALIKSCTCSLHRGIKRIVGDYSWWRVRVLARYLWRQFDVVFF